MCDCKSECFPCRCKLKSEEVLKCRCLMCDPENGESDDPWRFKIHRDFRAIISTPTDRISIGTLVSLSSGETGEVVSKNWQFYQVKIDQLEGEVRSFEDKHINPL